LGALLERDNGRCIYCLKKVTAEKGVLDHIRSQAQGGDNSYRNIAVSCHECNSRKGEIEAIDFIRSLYRNDILTETEFHERKEFIEKITTGITKPCP
jgi:5-methylcytosine-specific restriction endonuclease McrA